MRTSLSIGALVLAVIAAAISVLDDAQEGIAFFAVTSLGAGVQAWATRGEFAGPRRRVAIAIAWAWLIAAVWIDLLLAWYQAAASRTTPTPEATYLGLTATVYHLFALHAGALLVLLAAHLPERWVAARR